MRTTHDRARAGRRAATIRLEGLEDRALPSRLVLPPFLPTGPNPDLRIDTPQYVSQQAGGFDVTIARDDASSAGSPLTVSFTANSAVRAGAPVGSFTPVNEPVTFAAGVTSETVHVPVNPGAANSGSVPVTLAVQTTPPGYAAFAYLDLVSSPSAVPPTPPAITGAQLIAHGGNASAIAITFSGPMDRASVENVRAYLVNTWRDETYYDYFGLVHYKAETARPIAIAAARYDPATYTVNLIPKRPLKTTGAYTISSPNHLTAADTLTDASGTALIMTSPLRTGPGPIRLTPATLPPLGTLRPVGSSPAGTFQFTLRGNQALSWAAPEPNVIGGS